MGHVHGHAHALDSSRALGWGILLNVVYTVLEAVAGVLFGSLALLADATHNLTDVLGLVFAWIAVVLARRPSTTRRTYGLRRATILAALANGLLLFGAVAVILWEAVERLREPIAVPGRAVMLVALVGVLINTGTAIFLRRGQDDVNVRAAFWHMAADAAVSVGVVLGGALILWTGWPWIDPVVSILISAVVAWGTWDVLREAFELALDAVPRGIELAEVAAYLEGLDGVSAVHDLHVWPLSTTETALTAHLVKPDPGGDDELLARVARELHERFGIDHVTLQIERSAAVDACRQNGCC